jgi:hypothetical protein
MITPSRFAKYDEDGNVSVAIVEDGLPQMWYNLPAPLVTEVVRQARVDEAKRSAWLEGYWIVSERRTRNPVFDKRGEKSTTELVVRPCRNEDEAAAVLERIRQILSERGTWA